MKKLLKFRYVNWRGDEHEYVIDPTDDGLHLSSKASEDGKYWVISGQIVTRDGDPRPEMDDNRRRTFVLVDMKDIEEVEA